MAFRIGRVRAVMDLSKNLNTPRLAEKLKIYKDLKNKTGVVTRTENDCYSLTNKGFRATQTIEGNRGLQCTKADIYFPGGPNPDDQQSTDTFQNDQCKTVTTYRCFYANGEKEMQARFLDDGIVSIEKGTKECKMASSFDFFNFFRIEEGTKEKCIKATQDVIKNAPDLFMRLYNNNGDKFEYKIKFDPAKKHTGSEITFETFGARPKEGDSVFIENESDVQIPIGIFTNIQESKSGGYIVTVVILNGLVNNDNKEL